MTLFWKIFLGFWLTVLLMVSSAIWIANTLRHDEDIPLHGALARHFDSLQQRLQHEGHAVLGEYPHHPADEPDELIVADIDNHILWPQQASKDAMDELVSLSPINPASKHIYHNMLNVGVLIHADNSEILKIIARQPLPPPHRHVLFIAIALVVSAIICSFLTRAFVKPLRQISKTAGSIAEGELDARVNMKPSLLGVDELHQLASNFDHMAEKLEQSIQAHRQLLHDVSHELRSPLTRIRLAVELAYGKNNPVDNAIDNALKRIDKECEQLNELIGELLSLPQLDAQILQFDEQVDLLALLEDRMEAAKIEANAGSKQLQLKNNTGKTQSIHSVLVKGRADLLARVIDNLLSNALRYSPENGVVTVTLDKGNMDITLSVQDQGSGVPVTDIERIFEPFVRIETARERRGNGGFGLGLALVKRIVLVHGGRVTANNTSPGLRVDVHLPLSVEKAL